MRSCRWSILRMFAASQTSLATSLLIRKAHFLSTINHSNHSEGFASWRKTRVIPSSLSTHQASFKTKVSLSRTWKSLTLRSTSQERNVQAPQCNSYSAIRAVTQMKATRLCRVHRSYRRRRRISGARPTLHHLASRISRARGFSPTRTTIITPSWAVRIWTSSQCEQMVLWQTSWKVITRKVCSLSSSTHSKASYIAAQDAEIIKLAPMSWKQTSHGASVNRGCPLQGQIVAQWCQWLRTALLFSARFSSRRLKSRAHFRRILRLACVGSKATMTFWIDLRIQWGRSSTAVRKDLWLRQIKWPLIMVWPERVHDACNLRRVLQSTSRATKVKIFRWPMCWDKFCSPKNKLRCTRLGVPRRQIRRYSSR